MASHSATASAAVSPNASTTLSSPQTSLLTDGAQSALEQLDSLAMKQAQLLMDMGLTLHAYQDATADASLASHSMDSGTVLERKMYCCWEGGWIMRLHGTDAFCSLLGTSINEP